MKIMYFLKLNFDTKYADKLFWLIGALSCILILTQKGKHQNFNLHQNFIMIF